MTAARLPGWSAVPGAPSANDVMCSSAAIFTPVRHHASGAKGYPKPNELATGGSAR